MIDASEYCRTLETYLCQKNEGHLIRIVGPVFDQVRGWAAMGVPLAVACRGVDRYCERYYSKGPRRRPVRIEFCEADILELFDDWRRAVGVPARPRDGDDQDRRGSLPAHLDRVIARLTARRGGQTVSPAFDGLLDSTVRELDAARSRAKQARGEDRTRLIARLTEIDHAIMAAALAGLSPEQRTAHAREAADEIAPFAARMAPASRARAVQTAFERLVRDALGLPTVLFE
jgi:hypothetical protein